MSTVFISGVEDTIIGYKSNQSSLGRFRRWHVESLLNQAADLFDRCLRERSEYNDLRAKWDLLDLEKTEVERAQRLTDDHVNTGLLDIELRRLNIELTAKRPLVLHYNEVLNHLAEYKRLLGDNNARYSVGADENEAVISKGAYQLDLNIKETQEQWEQTNKDFRQRAINEAKLSRTEKTKLMTDEKGSLSYNLQYPAIGARVERDFKDAYDRIQVAYAGLKDFYAFDKDTPNKAPPSLKPSEDGYSPIDACVLWVRDAIRWLIAFGQLDQAWTCVFSVRTLIGESDWKRAIAQSNKRISFTPRLPKESFESHSFVRLRGISAFLISKSPPSSPWSGRIQLPSKAISRQLWGNAQTLTYVDLEQDDLPKCHLGRIETRLSPRAPEIAGLVSLMNASPIGSSSPGGNWTITMSPPSNKINSSHVEDIEIELNLLGRPNYK